jgi:hypothetical protein
MSDAREISGRCLCGAVRFAAKAKDNHVGACHCHMCQRWTAGPFLTVDCEPGSVRITGEEQLGVYASSEWGERCFCKTCGTPLFWRMQDGSLAVASAGALDDKRDLTFFSQIFVDEKPAYYAFANETSMMTGAEVVAMMTGGTHDP